MRRTIRQRRWFIQVLLLSFCGIALAQESGEEAAPEVLLEAHSTGFYRPTLIFFPAEITSLLPAEPDSSDTTESVTPTLTEPDSIISASRDSFTVMQPDTQVKPCLADAGIAFNERLRFALEWSGYIRLEVGDGDTLIGPAEFPDMGGPATELRGEFIPLAGRLRARLSLSEPGEEPFYRGAISFDDSMSYPAADAAAEEILRQLTGMVPPFRSRVICVEEHPGDTKELVLLDYDGNNRQQLTNDSSIALSPSWSPDGKRIVFCSFRASEDADLYIADLEEGIIKPLIRRKGTDAAPSWSPTGDWIVFAGSHGVSTDLYLIRSDGTEQRNLTMSQAINTSPSWSPTGRDIVFMSDRSGSPQIYRMDIDGTNLLRLTYEGNYNADPAWSPSGEWIVYVRLDNKGFQLRIMDPGGDVDIPLTNEPGDHLEPSWSPDGMRITYSYRGKLWVMNADGTARRALLARGLMPDWSPIPPVTEIDRSEAMEQAGEFFQQDFE